MGHRYTEIDPGNREFCYYHLKNGHVVDGLVTPEKERFIALLEMTMCFAIPSRAIEVS